MQIAAIKPDLDKPNPKIGISTIQFSSDNRFMFSRNGEIKILKDLKDLNFEIKFDLRFNAKYFMDLGYGKI